MKRIAFIKTTLLCLIPLWGVASCSSSGSAMDPASLEGAGAVAATAALPKGPPPATIPWLTSLKEAKSQALKENKPILVTLHTSWCGYCRKMEAEVFPDEKVRQAAQLFVPLRLDGEKEGRELARRLQVTGFPATWVLTPDAYPALSIPGYVPSETLTQGMFEGLTRYQKGLDLEKKHRANPDDLDTLIELTKLWSDRGNLERAEKLRLALDKADPGDEKGWLPGIYTQLGIAYVQKEQYDRAIPLLKRSAKESVSTQDIVSSHFNLAVCYALRREFKEAIPLVERVVALPDLTPDHRDRAEKLLTGIRQEMAGGKQ